MDRKSLRKVLVAIKKKIESVPNGYECVDVQHLEIIEELKLIRIMIGGIIEKIDLK